METQVFKENQDWKGLKVHEVLKVCKDFKETQDWKGLKVHEVLKENKVCKDFKEAQVCEDLKGSQDCRVHQQEEQSTLAGAAPPAPLTRELHSSTLAELEGLIIRTVEELQTFCVYQMILTISSISVECKDRAMLVE